MTQADFPACPRKKNCPATVSALREKAEKSCGLLPEILRENSGRNSAGKSREKNPLKKPTKKSNENSEKVRKSRNSQTKILKNQRKSLMKSSEKSENRAENPMKSLRIRMGKILRKNWAGNPSKIREIGFARRRFCRYSELW